MTQSLVPVSATEDPESLKAAIDMLNANTDARQRSVYPLVFRSKRMLFASLPWNPTGRMQVLNALEPAVRKQYQ